MYQKFYERNLRMIQNTERVDEWMSSMINKMSLVEETTNEGWVHQIVSRILKLVIYNFFMKLILFIYLYFVSNNIQFCEQKIMDP